LTETLTETLHTPTPRWERERDIYPLTLDSSSHWRKWWVSEWMAHGPPKVTEDLSLFFAANLLQMQTHHSDNDSHTHSSIIEPSEVLWAPPGCVVLCCAVSNYFWFQNCCCCWGTQEKEYEHGKALLLAGLANYCSTHPLCMLYFLLLFFLILHLPTFFFLVWRWCAERRGTLVVDVQPDGSVSGHGWLGRYSLYICRTSSVGR
jgi:hypothetical protein